MILSHQLLCTINHSYATSRATHRTINQLFGLDSDNYIGLLPQNNDWSETFENHYINSRIDPRILLAKKNGFLKSIDAAPLYKRLINIIPSEPPSLIHGDLWNGNVLFGADGIAVLIDPAVSYSYREFDIAMMNLFQGFDQVVFEIYIDIFPLEPNWKERLEIYKLYYLLVHLNMFGASYEISGRTILEKY